MSAQSPGRASFPVANLIVAAIVIGILLFLFSFLGQFYYFFERVEAQEVGVQFQSGQIVDIVGPGVYNDIGLFVELKRVSSTAVAFTVTDPELITKDKQRIGLTVTGDIFRPGVSEKDTVRNLWANYSNIYTDDAAAQATIEQRARQAMKVCVGDRNFDDAVIGTARDDLRACITSELGEMAGVYGLKIANVAVPDVILQAGAQERLDEIVQSRLQTEKARQDELRAKAEAAAEQARQEGEIRVMQSRLQEETRQQTTLAVLEQQKLDAQKAVIEAQKANDLFSAQKDLEIQKVMAAAATERAKAEIATQLALAEMFANHPAFLQLQIAEANASALQPSDKIIFTPEGTTPTIVLPGPGIVPTVDTGQAAQTE